MSDIELASATRKSGGSRDEEQGATEEHEPTTAFHALPDTGTAQGVGLDGKDGSEYLSDAHNPLPSLWLTDARKRTLVTCMYMSVCTILGCLLRIALAQLFGEGCKNPGSIGWLAAGEPLCITDIGRVTREGGVIFADLPANLLGSFIMGMMQTCAVLGLPKNMPIPWMRASSSFQKWDILHLAIRTGFCGSLTTFSSWNSEMVIMIYGVGNNRRTQIGLALFGYLIGVETALGSFVFGKSIAIWIYNRVNPSLHEEAVASRAKEARGMHINRNLPDFERRYLPQLGMDMEYYDPDVLELLERWRATTAECRLITSDDLASLIDVETKVLVHGEPVSDDAREKAERLGWDVKALEAWVIGKKVNATDDILAGDEKPLYEQMRVAVPIFAVAIGLLIFGIAVCNDDTAVSITYRTMWYSCLLAPLGSILRWKLSAFNGKLTLRDSWTWIPAGTLAANLIACIISITMIAVELVLHSSDSEWVQLTLLAIKIGIAGSLSTVSTFISEVHGLMKSTDSQYSGRKGYKYILLTLLICCSVCTAIYGWIVYVIGDGGNYQEY
mmetsp:Transcript_11854/g.25040  ORF Transcript_11854/g.25040 Transcript_11854/m.25040 type:complete len:557 (+) Transcript_11854:148-1818(+)